MPTYESDPRFVRDWAKLTDAQKKLFIAAVAVFVADLRGGKGFTPGLRVKKMRGHANIWELTWAPDGRATFDYRDSKVPGEIHVAWRRIGTHDIFKQP